MNNSIIANFLLLAMEIFEIRMAQGLFNSDAIVRVENQQLAKKVQGLLIHVGEESVEGSFLHK